MGEISRLLADEMRLVYRTAHACTVKGLARRYRVKWVTAFEALSGAMSDATDLVQERIDRAAELRRSATSRVTPEPAARTKYLRLAASPHGGSVDWKQRGSGCTPPNREPYVSLVGASARSGAAKRYRADPHNEEERQ